MPLARPKGIRININVGYKMLKQKYQENLNYTIIFYRLLKEWVWNLQLTTKRATSLAL